MHHGYLLIADLSGYTAYLTSTEVEHANAVIASLLEVMVEQIDDPIQLWRLEGDAVLAYTKDSEYPSGDTLLTIADRLYTSFAQRRQDIHANTTCTCRACAKVPQLDLKLIVHHGAFEELQIGPMRDISGPAAILVHRLTKTNAAKATGVTSYALFSEAAWTAMNEPKGLKPHQAPIEHFGDVGMHVYDLAAAWETMRAARQRVYIPEEQGVFTRKVELSVTPAVAWELLMTPAARTLWMGLRSVAVHADNGRPGPGARYHCVHETFEFSSWVLDWNPFQYVSNRYLCAFDPSLSHQETYEITPLEDGCEVRYTTAPMYHPDHPHRRYPEQDAAIAELYATIYDPGFVILAELASGQRKVTAAAKQ
jgi:hypothetical protein